MKKALALILALTMALALTACGGAAASSQAPAASSKAPASSVAADSADASVATEPETADESVNLADYLTEAYEGTLDDSEEIICLAFNEDASLSVLAVSGEAESVSFVGEGVDNGDGTMTITDEENGMAISFAIEILDDSTISLDMGDLGTATLVACDVEEVVNLLNLIAENTTAVA